MTLKKKMEAIERFCRKNDIATTNSNDSYYFIFNDQKYRVSNHAVESRNNYDSLGNLTNARGYAMDDTRENDTIYIHASKNAYNRNIQRFNEWLQIKRKGTKSMRKLELYDIDELKELDSRSYERAIENAKKNSGGTEVGIYRYLKQNGSEFDKYGNEWWKK